MIDTLPRYWEIWPLANVGEWSGGGTPTSTEAAYWDGDIPWVTPKDMKARRIASSQDKITPIAIESSAAKMIDAGSVLFVTRSGILAHSFPVATMSVPTTTNQDLKAITPVEVIDVEYLAWALRAFERTILKTCSKHGTTVHSIEMPALKRLGIPVSPLNEQRRIVAKVEELFSELDKGVESLTTARAQLKAYRQSVLKHAFEGKLTEEWRAANQDKVQTPDQLLACLRRAREAIREVGDDDLSNLPSPPAGYVYTYLSNLGDLARGKSKHRPRNDPRLFGGEYPFIQTGEVKAANRIIRNFGQTYNEVGLAQSHLWPKGTLCITIAANIAETAFLGFDACFPDSVVGFTALPETVLPEYVELFIKAVRVRIEAYAPATAQKNINLTTLENLIMPLCSLEEQKQIVSCVEHILSVADANESETQDNLTRCEVLRQSILKQAFSGQLVAQDPADEPASVLLERIRAGQDEGRKKKRRNTKNGQKEAA